MAEQRDPHDGEYIGNIFGPKLTRYGLIFLLFFIGLALYRHWSMGVGPGWVLEEPVEEEQLEVDTIGVGESQE